MLRCRQMRTLQKFASVHANIQNQFATRPFGSTSTATSPTAKPRRAPTQPHWLSGKTSWPEPSVGKGYFRQLETNCG